MNKSDSLLALSGILREEESEFVKLLDDYPITVLEIYRKEEWINVVCKRKDF